MVELATEAFDAVMKTPNQIQSGKQKDVKITTQDLLDFGPRAPITEAGVRTNVSVGVQYLEAWLRGSGAVPIFNLMEDAATAEISRAQLWQWVHSPLGKEELEKVRTGLGADRYGKGRFPEASELFDQITTDDSFVEFLTLPGYERLG